MPTKIPTTGEASTPWWMLMIALLSGVVVGWLVRRRKTI
ncbi:MAG: LPXTG cell wall anchor domain-containing protein [Chloroflexi bacterium]|nr:LPXTG cell wall anchor domain-containing protein [Chloroflexota bacterium]